jgi:serine/threonine protein kinase
MELNEGNIQAIFNQFDHNAHFNSHKELTSGHINDTFFIETHNSHNYVLQRINSYVFKKAKELIVNKVAVSEHIQNKLQHLNEEEQNKRVLKFVKTKSGLPYFEDEDGNFWNVTLFIEGSKIFEKVTNVEIAYEGGKLYGDFLNLTNGIDTEIIVDIIPNFHEMSFRFEQFDKALANASSQRLELAKDAIIQAQNLREEMHILQNLKNAGKIPLRITHNDTKISNALFDKSNKGLCVIDTDTVMVGIIHYDFGDAVRTICNNAYEDEKDLSKVTFNVDFYKAFTKGFLEMTFEQLTMLDVSHLALAGKTITFIMGLRMLTDFLNNDVYYKTAYELHNLDRTKNQFKLVDSISENFQELNDISKQEYQRLLQN